MHMPDAIPADDSGTTAELVLVLDAAITACRAGQPSGVPSLNSVNRVLADVAAKLDRRTGRQAPLPARPNQLELTVLTVLADVYGSSVLTTTALGTVLRLIAHRGGVRFLQRTLWGDADSDQRLAASLAASGASFAQLSVAYADILLADANVLIRRFRLHPPAAAANNGPAQ